MQYKLEEIHEQWKERQYFGEILRFQIQREASKASFAQTTVINPYTRKIPVVNNITDKLLVEVSIMNAIAIGLISSAHQADMLVSDRKYSMRISLGPWSCVVGNGVYEQDTLGDVVSWANPILEVCGKLSMEEMRIGEQFRIEIHENSPNGSAIIALSTLAPMALLNHNMGELKSVDVQLYRPMSSSVVKEENAVDHAMPVLVPDIANDTTPPIEDVGDKPTDITNKTLEMNLGQPLCLLRLVIMASAPPDELISPPEFDPQHQTLEEVPVPKTSDTPVIEESVRLSNAGVNSVQDDSGEASDVTGHHSKKDNDSDFSDLVAGLRGDGLYYVRSLIGAVYYEDVKKLSCKDLPVSSNVKVR